MRLHIICPHCSKPAKSTHLRQLSLLVTEVYYRCDNVECGARFATNVEVIRQLQLPANVNPAVNVPLSPMVNRRGLADAIDLLRDAVLPRQGELRAGPGQLDIFNHAQGAGP